VLTTKQRKRVGSNVLSADNFLSFAPLYMSLPVESQLEKVLTLLSACSLHVHTHTSESLTFASSGGCFLRFPCSSSFPLFSTIFLFLSAKGFFSWQQRQEQERENCSALQRALFAYPYSHEWGEKEREQRKKRKGGRLEATHAAHSTHPSRHATARGTLLLRSVDNASFGGEEEL
jgi:hypothetical protein